MSDEKTPDEGPAMVTPDDKPAVPVSRANGKQLLGATWALLRQDKELIALPFAGSIAGVVAAIIFFLPGYGVGWVVNGQENGDVAYYAGVVLAGFGATLVGVFFQTALVIGANQRADGGNPTAGSCLRGAWGFKWRIVQWSLVTATVGLVLRAVQERLGFLGALLNFFGGLAWGIATFVVVPVVVTEDVGPVTAVKRSAQVLRDTWGTSLRTAARGGVIAFALWIVPTVALVGGIALAASGTDGLVAAGIVLAAVALVALIVLATVFSAVGAYARALIYRYAVGMPTPGIDDVVLAGAFRPKGAK